MKYGTFLSMALCLLAVDAAEAGNFRTKSCRRRTKTTTPATDHFTPSSSTTPVSTAISISTPDSSITVSTSTPGSTVTPSSSSQASPPTEGSSTPLSSTVVSTPIPTVGTSTPVSSNSVSSPGSSSSPSSASISSTPGSTAEPSSTAESTSTPSSSTAQSSSTESSTVTSIPSSTLAESSTSSTLISTSSSSSAAPAPTAISPFQLRSSTGKYVSAPVGNTNYFAFQEGSGSIFVIDEATGYLRVSGGGYLCAGYNYSYQTSLVDCNVQPPANPGSNRRYVSCVQSLEDHAVRCSVPIVSCTPGGCTIKPGQYDQFSINTEVINVEPVMLSQTGETKANVVPRPVTAVEPAPSGN